MNRTRSLHAESPTRAFTLLELLVVIAVITLLAALTLPALVRSRSAAQATVCTSNLRQVGLATQLYWDDHRGIAFVERGSRTNNGWNYWFGWLEDGAEGKRRFDPATGALWPYLQSRGVEVCPALNRANPRFKSKARGAAFGYGYNLRVGTRGTSGVPIATLRSPAGCAVFADCAQINDFQPPPHPNIRCWRSFITSTSKDRPSTSGTHVVPKRGSQTAM